MAKKDTAVNDEISLHDLLKDERQRFRESKSPKMSDVTAEDFRSIIAKAVTDIGAAGVDYEKLRDIVREELATALGADTEAETETETENPDGEQPEEETETETEDTAGKRQRRQAK